MEALPAATAPRAVPAAGPPDLPGEPARLARLAAAGIELAPAVWVPPAAEEAFYRWSHLPPALADLFAPVASRDPDEDDVEDLIPEAEALLARHVLLDAWVDAFYDAIAPLPERLRVRRPGAEGRTAARGRPALLALRRAWADAWAFEPVLARLRATGGVALEAAPLLVHDAEERPADAALASRVHEALQETPAVWTDGAGRVTRVASGVRPAERAPGG